MKEFVIRKPDIDLTTPVARHWCGNDAFKTAFFDAMSMSFPTGEQFFLDSFKKAIVLLSASEKEELNSWLRGFIGQETFHRKYHEQFNAMVASKGVKNYWDKSIQKWQRNIVDDEALVWVALTAALEHFTAILSYTVLKNQEVFDGTEDRLRRLWLWHASEELEHREMALHLYHKLKGTEELRLWAYRDITRKVIIVYVRQVVANLWYDGSFFKPSTWVSAVRFLFGRKGIAKGSFGLWKAYLSKDFSPKDLDAGVGEDWLAENLPG